MKKKYFGTDGVRGKVGEHPITPDFMLKLGWAVGKVLSRGGHGKVVIGKDTRISGYMFESALEAGLSAAGVDILLLGPIPTPAIAYLTRTLHADAGIVISASHNPFYDNGVKFFSADGMKLADDVELMIEEMLEEPMTTVSSDQLGKAERMDDARGRYIEFCKSTIPSSVSLKGMHIIVDCAHGATYQVAPNVFDEIGARVTTIGVQPDGLNINQDVGSTKPEAMREMVLSQGADVGIGLDGDGDRLIMVDEKGEIVDGDEILFIIAMDRVRRKALKGGVVGTLMTNLGMEIALREEGVEFHRSKVGDRYVMELLKSTESNIGGEGSGHIICLDCISTGDGTISALQVLAAMRGSGKTLYELKSGMTKFPQTLINVAMSRRIDPASDDKINSAVKEVEAELGDNGRVLLRLSGTEPLVRVMVEGREPEQVDMLARKLARVVEKVTSG
ncbi:MAG TPA: phosphoglucosamine mutase [Gammaproteobacteria bacterium]|nr:phosphoglucosamine mutase [Gammaproteobacteria bacterium]